MNYGIYGSISPFRSRLRPDQMGYVSTNDLLKRIHRLTSYQHEVFYYGSKDINAVKSTLDKYHKVPDELQPTPPNSNFIQQETEKNQVLFVNFDGMAQAEVMLLSKGTPSFDLEQHIMNQLYNQYFGAGLSSVVFQEIRESRALAYSAYTFNGSPNDQDKAHYLRAFVGTQTDKIKEAIPALQGIIEDIPISEDQIANSVDAIVKKIESERIIKTDIYWTKKSAEKRGLEHDIRSDSYGKYKALAQDKSLAVKALKDFHDTHIKGRKYTYMVLGDKDKMDLDYLKTLGEFKEISLKDLFGY
jgi:predicted Zn-dependent peptidase